MQKPCEFCGKPFEARRAAARFCGDTCKKRQQRAGGSPLSVVPDVAQGESPEPAIVATTRRELEAAGVAGTTSAQAALILAALIADGHDSGSSIARMVQELRVAMADALASVSRADQMDEVTRRRDEKLRAAGRT